MRKNVEYDLRLDRSPAVYKPGETVTGRVDLRLNKSKEFKCVSVRFEGFACVCLSDDCTDSEHYINEEIILIGKDMVNRNTNLHRGYYTYSFSYQLPNNLPSSFHRDDHKLDFKFDLIRYSVRLKVDTKNFVDEKVIKIFRVESPLDLNTLDANRFNCPFTADGNLTRSLFVLFEQSYKIIVRLNKRAFVPGELIRINASISNETSRDLEHLKLKLIQVTELTARGHKQKIKKELVVEELGTVRANKIETLNNLTIKVPNLKILSYVDCNLINFKYYLVFSRKVFAESYFRIPIVIGSVPFLNAPPNLTDLFARIDSNASSLGSSSNQDNDDNMTAPAYQAPRLYPVLKTDGDHDMPPSYKSLFEAS